MPDEFGGQEVQQDEFGGELVDETAPAAPVAAQGPAPFPPKITLSPYEKLIAEGQTDLGPYGEGPFARERTGAGAEGIIAARSPLGLATEIASIPAVAGAQALTAVGRQIRQLVSPTTYLPEEEQAKLRPFVISREGELRPQTLEEMAQRDALQAGRPLLPVQGTQLQPEGSEFERMVSSLSTPESILMLAGGGASKLAGAVFLGSMAPGVLQDITSVASGTGTGDEKRDRINALLLPVILGLRAAKPGAAESSGIETEMGPLVLTGGEIPGLPRGATPIRPTAGPEVLGPQPPRRLRTPGAVVPTTEAEAQRQIPILREIRDRDLRTKEQIQKAFPLLKREEAGELRRLAWGTAGEFGVEVAPKIPRPSPMPPLTERTFEEVDKEVQRQEQARIEAINDIGRQQRRSQIEQNIIFWERELEFALKRNDGRAQDEAIKKLMQFRQEYEGIPSVKQIAPKPPIARAPSAAFRPEVPGTPAEPREDVASVIRRKQIRTRTELLNEFPAMRQNPGAREQAGRILRQVWGTEAPPAAPPTPPPPEEPPAPAPAAAPVAPPPAPPAAPAAAAETPPVTPKDLALEEQRKAGWDPKWPFVPADFQNKSFRDALEADPTLSAAEKDRMFAAAEKLLGGRIERAAPPATEAPPVETIPPVSETIPPPAATPATIEGTVIAGKTLGEWEAVRDPSQLPRGNARAELARYLAVPNQPGRILQALGNKKRTREIHAPPVAPEAVTPVAPEVVAPAPEPPAPAAAPEVAPAAVEPSPEEAPNEARIAELKRQLAKEQKALDKNVAKMGTMVPPPIVSEITRKISTRMARIQDEIDALEKPATTPAPELPAAPAPAPAAPPPAAAPTPEQAIELAPESKAVSPPPPAALPTQETTRQFLSVPEPDLADQREASKFAQRQMAELYKQQEDLRAKLKAAEAKVKSTRGWNRGRIKSSAKASDIKEYQNLQKQLGEANTQYQAIERSSRQDRLAVEVAGEARRVNDPNVSLLERLAARQRMYAATGETVPADLAKAVQSLSQEEVRKRFPDATKQELEELGREVERSSMLHVPLDKEFELNPVFRGLYQRRREILENVAFQQQAPFTEFSPELRLRIGKYTTRERPSELYQTPVENLPSAELEAIKAQITDETATIRKNAAALQAKREAELEAEKAKEQELLGQAQAVADSLPHVGRPGAPSADSVRLDLTGRIKGAIDDAIQRSKVKLTRSEAGDYFSEHGDQSITGTGTIEEERLKKGGSSFHVVAWRLSDSARKVRATVKTREQAEWMIKAAAAETPGRAIIGVPGDGVYTLNRTGIGLLETWAQARNLDVAGTIEAGVPLGKKAREGKGGRAEAPPDIPKTVEDWNETKEYYGLQSDNKIAEYSPELKRLAESAEKKIGKAASQITTSDVDEYVKTLEGKPSKGPGAAARAEFEEDLPPDQVVIGLSAGNPVWNRMVRQFQNFTAGVKQLGARRLTRREFQQLLNFADNFPRMAGQEAGNSIRLRTANIPEQNAITALMQALKMSGEGLSQEDAARLGDLEFAGDPIGYLRSKQTDLETFAQQMLNEGKRLEAGAAIDLANAMKLARARYNQLRPVAILARQKFDRQFQRERLAGIDTDYERWYVPQRHDLDLLTSADRPIVLGSARGSGMGTGFKKAKVYEDYASAIEAGFVPRTLSIADLLEHRVAQGERLIARKSFFNGLKSRLDPVDGKAIVTSVPRRVITRPDGSVDVQETIPIGYSRQEVIPGVNVAVHKGYARMISALTGRSAIADSATISTLQNIAAFEKHIGLALDTFHASRTLQTEFMLTHKLSLGARQRLGRALVEYSLQDLDAAVSKGEITQEMADYIRTPVPVEVNGRTISLSPKAMLNIGIKSGVNVARFADVIYRDWLREIPVTGAVNRWVFDKMTRSAIAHGFISEFQRVAKAHPEWTARQVGLNVARDINVLFGNLQKESIFRNPTLRAINQIVFLAPQWVESLARRESRAVLQLGQAGKEVLFGRPLGLPERVMTETGETTIQRYTHVPRLGSVGRAMGTGVASYLVATQILNLITRGHLTFSNEEEGHKLDAWIPGGTHGFFISPLSVFGEITHDIIRYAQSQPDFASALARIGANKLGNLGRAIGVMVLGRDALTGEKLIGTSRRAWTAALQAVPVPITASAGLKTLGAMAGVTSPPPPGGLQRQLTASLGFKTEPVPSAQNQIYAIADRWKLSQGPKLAAQVEQRLKEEFGPSRYGSLRTALLREDITGAKKAYQALRDEGATPQTIRQTIERPHPFAGSAALERRFHSSLTPQQKELYRKAIEEREEMKRRFRRMLSTR